MPGPDDTSRSAVLAFSDGTETVETAPGQGYRLLHRQGQRSLPHGGAEREAVYQMDRMAFSPEDGVSQALLIPGDRKAKADFITSAETAMGYSTAVVNLVRNPGGNGDLPIQWFRALTGAEPGPITARWAWTPSAGGAREARWRRGATGSGGRSPSTWSGRTDPSSSSSPLAPLPRLGRGSPILPTTWSRTLVVGSNTGGCLTGSQTWFDEHLPWSGLELAWGMDLFTGRRTTSGRGLAWSPMCTSRA